MRHLIIAFILFLSSTPALTAGYGLLAEQRVVSSRSEGRSIRGEAQERLLQSSQSDLGSILRELRGNPGHPQPWYRLAYFAMREGAPLSAYEIGVMGQGLAEHRKDEPMVSPDSFRDLIKQASYEYANLIAGGGEVLLLRLWINNELFSPADLVRLASDPPRGFVRASATFVTIRSPAPWEDELLDLLEGRSAEFKARGLYAAASVLDESVSLFRAERSEYGQVLAKGRERPGNILDFIERRESSRFVTRAEKDFAQIVVSSAYDRTRREGSVRGALHELLVWRSKLKSPDVFNETARTRGISYLDRVAFARGDILLDVSVPLGSRSLGVLGDIDKAAVFVSVVKAGEVVVRDGNWLRGLITHAHLDRVPDVITTMSRQQAYEGREIWGNAASYLSSRGLSWNEVLSNAPPASLPERFSPLTKIKESSTISGGVLGGIADFVEEHPLASALIAGTVAYAVTRDSGSPRRDGGGESSTGSLGIKVVHGSTVSLTATQFQVKIEGDLGDPRTSYIKQERGSGSSFVQSGYATFSLLRPGRYKISISGYIREANNLRPFSMDLGYAFPGGAVVCVANIDTRSFYCPG